MKSKIKRHSRSALAVILTLSMLVSCMMVGLIATDAAKTTEERVGAVDNSESVGAIDKWIIKSYPGLNGYDNWAEHDMFSGQTGSYYVDRGSGANSGTIYFLTAAYEDNQNHWCCKSGNIPLDTETQLVWDTSSQMSVNVSKRFVTFTITSGNKLTITESDTNPIPSYIHSGTSDNTTSNWSTTGELIDNTTGYNFTLNANDVRSFGFNHSSTDKNNIISIDNFSYSPSASFAYAQKVTLDGVSAVKFKAKVAGTYNVKFDGSNVTITGPGGGDDPETPTTYYIVGDSGLGLNWTAGSFITMTNTDTNVYSWTSDALSAGGPYTFRVKDKSDWSGSNIGFTNLTAVVDNDYITTANQGNENNIALTIKSACILTVTYNTSTDKLTVSAVEDTTETVDIYAKNGTLRDSTFNRFTNLADTDFDITYFEYTESLDSGVFTYNSIDGYNAVHSKKITCNNAVSGYNSDYAIMKNVPIGAKIKIKTTLSDDSTKAGSFNNKAFKDTHYLKAYSFNGMSYQVNTPNNTGVYEEIWTVRDVNTKSADGTTNLTKNGNTVEVTPIYYMQDNSNCKTFYIDGYDGTVQNAWGNMLCVYPYYEGMNKKDNAFGGYPGQPMLFWGGKYQMEIPLTVDGTASGASVKGLTLHNGYWDLLHRSLDIRCNDRNHAQTYDYDDFYKLYKEKNPDTIIFDFKYRTAEDNYNDGYQYEKYNFANNTTKRASDYTGSGHNGVEIVTDYFGRQVDAFGNLIADANKSHYGEDNGSGGTFGQSNEILFVSTGYKDTYVGEYATIWATYAPDGSFIGYISSSMLYLNNIDRRLQYTGGDSTASGRMSWSNFISTYNTLKSSYTGVPALIVYDREIWNDSKDKAYRSDGKWYYSNKSDQIEANIIIQYNSNAAESAAIVASKDRAVADTSKWTTDAFSSTAGVGGYNNIGSVTECSAYFTNTSPNLLGKVESGTQFADSTKSFTFRADAGGQYMFLDWVRLSNGKYYEITEKELAESPMSSNDTYIARFVKSASGSLKISHVIEQNGTYKGTGTPTVTVTVSNGSGTQVFNDSSNDGTPIDISSYVQTKYSTYTVNISLSTTPDEDCTLQEIVTSAAQKYHPGAISSNAATVDTFTVQDIIEGNVSTLRYVSHLTKTVFHYNYEITYTYYSRFWGEQSYTQTGECENGDFTGSKTGATLTTDFIIGKTPYEKSFRQQINWNYTSSAIESAGGENDHGAQAMQNNAATAVSGQDNTYKMTAHVYASNTVNDKVTAEFVLPYKYNAKSQGYTVKDTDVYTDNDITGKTYLYDTGNESVSLNAKAYNLFTYDDLPHTGSDDTLASGLPLMEAAPYVWMNVDYHTKPANTKRYYTGNSFKVGNTTYYLREKPDGSAAETNEEIITDAAVREGHYSVTFTKRSNMTQYGGDGHTTTYKYAVASGTPGTLDYKVYFFAYAMNANEEMVDNEGRVIDFDTEDPVFNGQYIVYSESQEKDGIIEGTGVKKYFTRWDIYNTKGDFVASCYNRRFNYSGYDNYVIKPIYDSDTENNYASSLGTDIGSSITYLDDSRNQWKGTGASGSYASTTGQTDLYAADKLFTDFAITYSYNGENINTVSPYDSTSGTGADIKIGVVIERLDSLDKVGSAKITSASYYADKYKTDTDWENLATALKNGTTLTDAVSGDHKCYNSKIGANVSGFGTQFGVRAPGAVSGQTSVIDNFNRLQWFYTINNSTQRGENTAATVTEMKNYAYRAISYMIVTDSTGTKAYLCDAPTYFTIYDTATRVGY